MQNNELENGYDSLVLSNPADALDFLNSSDNENEDLKEILDSHSQDQEQPLKENKSQEQSAEFYIQDYGLQNDNNNNSNAEEDLTNDDSSSLTLSITNVVVMASMKCHLRLKEIARTSVDVEYKALQNHVIMRLRSPYTVATIWSSGKIWCTGANSLAKAKVGARRIARRIAKCGFPCQFSKYRIVNIMATCKLPFRVRLEELVKEKPMLMSYEPELAPGLTFKTDRNSSTSLKVFSTGRVVIMGTSLDSIGSLVEELVPLAALHQTEEPVSDVEDLLEQERAEARAAAKAARFMLPGSVRLGELSDLVAEMDGEEDENSTDSDTNEDGVRNGYSTDDSTDSGASIDSGGVSTKPKRKSKRKTQYLSSLSFSTSNDPSHFMTTHDASSLSFPHKGMSDLGETSELRQNTSNSALNILHSDPTWCREAVASGSTKRARVITYSGTEDSGPEEVTNILTQQNQQILNQQNLIVQNPSHFQSSQQLKIIQPSVGSVNSSHAIAVSTATTCALNLNAPNSLQYVFIKPSQLAPQTVYNNNNNNTVPTIQQTMQISTPSITPIQSTPVIRVTVPTATAVDNHRLTMSLPANVYPIRLSTGVSPTFVSPTDAKVVSLNSTMTNLDGNQYFQINPTSHMVPQIYQVGQTPVVAGSNSPLVLGPTFYAPNSLQSSSATIRPSVRIPGSNILSNSSNIMVGQYPNTVSAVTLNTTSLQPVANMSSFAFSPAFASQYPGSLS